MPEFKDSSDTKTQHGTFIILWDKISQFPRVVILAAIILSSISKDRQVNSRITLCVLQCNLPGMCPYYYAYWIGRRCVLEHVDTAVLSKKFLFLDDPALFPPGAF